MKKTLLKTMAFLLVFLGGTNVAWADDNVSETLTATMDGLYRLDNSSATYDIAKSSQIEVKYYIDGETDKSFYGLLCFEVPAKSGYKVKSATLRFVSKKIVANRKTNFYKLGTDISTKPSFTDLSSYVTTALASTAIGSVSAEGQLNKQISSDAVDAETYMTIAKWQNSITLDASAVTAGEKLNLLIATSTDGQTSNSNSNRFFGKNAEEFTNSNISLTCTSDELVPKLTVTYEEDSDISTVVKTPTVDTYLRKGNTANHGSETTMELKTYSEGDADFVGYMSFDYSVPSGMELQSAKLRVVSAQIKGDRTLNFYSFAADVPSNAKYEDYATAISTAKGTTVVGTVELEGESSKSVLSDDVTTEKYQTITAWQNTVDLTDFVKTQTGSFGLLLARDDANNSNKIFSSDATGIENSNCTYFNGCTADDLVPQLTLVFKKSDSSTPTSLLTKDETQTVDGTYAYTEVYNLSGSTNTVKVTVTKTADTDGADVAVHGTVTATAATDANSNVTVTLTVTPENASHAIDGTPVVEIVASDSDGDQGGLQLAPRRAAPTVGNYVAVTDNGDGTYSFTMPSNSVEVSAKFKKLADVPVVAPTITYDEENNKVTLAFGAAQDGYNQATKIYYTTDGSDPKSSDTRLEITAETEVEVTSEMTTIKAVGVYDSNFSDVVEQTVSRRSYLNVTKEWVAFCSPNTYSVPTGLKAYTISAITQPADGQSGTVTLKEQNFINKNTPMLIQNTTDNLATTKFQIVAADDQDLSGDMCEEFKGTTTATTLTAASAKTFYVLKGGEFLRVANPGAVSAYNCWLEIGGSTPSNAPRYSIEVGGNTTRIDSIGTATIEGDDAWYTLSGVRVAQPVQKGIYIRNGKKIIVK